MATIFVPNFNFYASATFCPLDENGKKNQKLKNFEKRVKPHPIAIPIIQVHTEDISLAPGKIISVPGQVILRMIG